MKIRTVVVALFFLFLAARSGYADQTEPDESQNPVDIHMFASQGYIYSTGNNYLTTSKPGSFDFTEVGINFTKQLDDKLRVGLQLFSRDLGTEGNFISKMDWFYMDYHVADSFGVRAGRVKIPFGLYNEVNDVDAGRVPILLPQSIYPSINRDFLLAQTGVEAYGLIDMQKAGKIDYRFYDGTIDVDVTNNPGAPAQVEGVQVPYVVGSRIMWETPIDGFRVGGSIQALRLDTTLLMGGAEVKAEIPALLTVGSAEYTNHKLLLATEYSRWRVDVRSSNAALLPPGTSTSERAYVMGSYRFSDLVQPGLYYSVLYPDVDNKSGAAGKQNDLAATLRFDITRNLIIKAEGHYMDGTAGLDSVLNDNTPLSNLKDHWSVFLLKATVSF